MRAADIWGRLSVGRVLVLLLGSLALISLGRSIWGDLEGARRVGKLEEITSQLAEENKTLERELQRRQSLEFVEEEARRLGMVKEGERVLILPGDGGVDEGHEQDDIAESVLHWREWVRVFGFRPPR